MQIRIDKVLSQLQIATRSESKKMFAAGRVQINDEIVKNGAVRFDPERDRLFVDGNPVDYEEYQYWMLNKPAGCVTATEDRRDRTVMDYLPPDRHRNLSPVGRLDKDTEGLLLITDDGALNHALLAPGKHVEKEYFAGDSIITMFSLDKEPGISYRDKSRMVGLLMDTGADVVFLFDSPSFSGTGTVEGQVSGTVPFSVQLYVYDSMDSRDTVLQYSGSSMADLADMENTAKSVGNASGGKFTPRWRAEEIPFFLYDSQKWYETYFHVQDYEWQKAMDIWMDMLGTGDLEKKACIEYNIATACYLLGQYDLALEWVEMSATHFHLPYTASLKSMIEAKLGR